MKLKISLALAVFNEENNIVDCLESAKDLCNEFIVVDGSSTDRTRDLAEKLGAKVIKTTNKPMFHINKNLAIYNCKGDWVLLIDADERITKELREEIKAKIKSNSKENGFWINRRNWFLGGYLRKGGAYPDRVIRLFKKGKGKLPEESVHEQIKIDGEVGYLQNDLLHLADPNFERYLIRANRYTNETARKITKINPGKNLAIAAFYMIFLPLVTFLKIYIRHKGFRDGFRGFVWALFSASHHYYAYVKYLSGELESKPQG